MPNHIELELLFLRRRFQHTRTSRKFESTDHTHSLDARQVAGLIAQSYYKALFRHATWGKEIRNDQLSEKGQKRPWNAHTVFVPEAGYLMRRLNTDR